MIKYLFSSDVILVFGGINCVCFTSVLTGGFFNRAWEGAVNAEQECKAQCCSSYVTGNPIYVGNGYRWVDAGGIENLERCSTQIQ